MAKLGVKEGVKKTGGNGASGRIQTDDLSFTKALLYQLSYAGAEQSLPVPL